MNPYVFALMVLCHAAHARVPTGSSGGHFQTRMFDGQKVQQKAASRWTLADWLAQKNKIRLMDQWLAMNRSASFFEFNLSGAHSKYTSKAEDSAGTESESGHDSQIYRLDMYVTIFDLYGEYERTSDSREAWGGAAGLRLFGTSSQTTTLLARHGWRKSTRLDTQEVWENQFTEGELQLYVLDFFGLTGRYRKIFKNKSNLGDSLEGSRTAGGAFFEFGQFRIFAEIFREPLELKDPSGVRTTECREGYEAGLKIHL